MSAEDEVIAGEEEILALLAPLTLGTPGAFGLQDDCAVLRPRPGTELVLKTDPVAEGVHFLAGAEPEDIAWRALAVNVSDLVAKGAAPLGFLMALSFPAAPRRAWFERFANGLRVAQERMCCRLLGGDTDRRPGPMTVSITVFGEVPEGAMVRRGTAAAGNALFVSGTIGDALLGLELCKDPQLAVRWGLSEAQAQDLRRRYLRPEPRLDLAPLLRAHATAAMDISDGLAKDLGRMAKASGLGAEVQAAQLPLSSAARKVLVHSPQLLQALLAAGDDYEVLAAVPATEAEAFTAGGARLGVSLSRIGTMDDARSGEVVFRAATGEEMEIKSTGWDHFRA